MRRIRSLAVLASVVLMVGGVGLARAATQSSAPTTTKPAVSSTSSTTATTTCSSNEPGGDKANPNSDDCVNGSNNGGNNGSNADTDNDNDNNGGSKCTASTNDEGCNNGDVDHDGSNHNPKCDNDGDHDADDMSPACPPKPPKPPTCTTGAPENGKCEFDGATFYAAENNPMQIVVDASAVNAPSTKKSGNDPLPGDKITNTDCNAGINACDAVANKDADKDITDYTWTFTAYRADKNNQPSFVEQHTVDSGTSPSAAAQFTKTQGDDVVQIVLTISEKDESKSVVSTPMPVFPIFSDDTVTKADRPGTPTTPGSVIIEPCDHGGLITAPETLGDTLGDNLQPILAEPNVQGPISSAVEQNTAGSPASGIGNEVACLVSALPGGAL